MRSSMKLIWQACVVCLFLMVAVLVGTAGVSAYNPLDGTVASNLGTNTATAGQVATADGSGNIYWSNAQTNSAGGGGNPVDSRAVTNAIDMGTNVLESGFITGYTNSFHFVSTGIIFVVNGTNIFLGPN